MTDIDNHAGEARALTILQVPPELAAAIVAAQTAVATIERDAKGDKGAYASADAVARAAREALTAHGAAWMRVGVEFAPPGLDECDIGQQAYIGDLCERWVIVHKSGAALIGSSRMPVIASRGRPQDKAVGASLTYDVGHALRGALCLDREDKKHAVDKREDVDDGSWTPPAPRTSQQKAQRRVGPEPAPAPAPRKTTTLGMVPASDLADLDAAITRIAAAWEQSKGDTWRTLLGRADLPALKAPAHLSPATYKLVRAEADSAIAELDGFDADAREIAADLDGPPESADLVRTVEAVREVFPGTTEVGKAPAKARRSKGGES